MDPNSNLILADLYNRWQGSITPEVQREFRRLLLEAGQGEGIDFNGSRQAAHSSSNAEPPGWLRWIKENPREIFGLFTGANLYFTHSRWLFLLCVNWELDDIIKVCRAWPQFLRHRYIDPTLAKEAHEASMAFVAVFFGYVYAFLFGKLLSLLRKGLMILFRNWKWTGSFLAAIMSGRLLGYKVSKNTYTRIFRKLGEYPAWFMMGGESKLRAVIKFLKSTAPARRLAGDIKSRLLSLKEQPTFNERPVFQYPKDFRSETHIRILRLKRKIPFMDIEAEFVHGRLDNAPMYDAISYVWGSDQSRNSHFILHGKQFLVTQRVHDILASMSSWFGPRDIWIDSICINQDDAGEKQHQIPKMIEIYKNAICVRACLQGPEDSWLAGKYLFEILLHYALVDRNMFDALMLQSILIRKSDKWLSAQIDALLEFINNPWFTRIWIVQEFVAGPQIVIHYGGSNISWESIIQLHHLVTTTKLPMALRYSQGKPGNLRRFYALKQAYWLNEIRERLRNSKVPLYTTLAVFRESNASQARDKIIALLDISDASEELQHMRQETDPSNLLLAVAHHLVQNGTLIEVLSFAGLSRQSPALNLPSWVADWTSSSPMEQIDNIVHLEYKASGKISARITATACNSEILLSGVCVDHIVAVTKSDMPSALDTDSEDGTELLEKLEGRLTFLREAKSVAELYTTDPYQPQGMCQPLQEAISRTLVGDSGHEMRPAPAAYARLLDGEIAFAEATKAAILDPNFDYMSADDLMPFEQTPFARFFDDELSIAEHVVNYSRGHLLCGGENGENRFCVTEKKFIGMVPRNAVPGDVVCIVHGSSVLFVLRPSHVDGQENRYRLVGECYIHGMMDGEGLDLGLESDQLVIW